MPLRNSLRYWFDIFRRASRYWLDAQAFVYAAALAFFTVFSIAPVVIVAVSVVGLVLGEQAAQGELMTRLQAAVGEEAAGFVQTAVAGAQIENAGLAPTLMGFGLILLGATAVFAQMQKSLNAIWSVAPNPNRNTVMLLVKSRMMSLAVVLAIGFVLLVSLLLSVAVRAVMAFAENWLPVPAWSLGTIDVLLSLVVVTLLFAAMFRILPDVLLKWRDVWVGAAVTSVLFAIGRALIAIYLANTATGSAYGAAGSLVLLLMWVNYSSLILLFGAAITRAHLEARGGSVVPRPTAVAVQRELMTARPPGA